MVGTPKNDIIFKKLFGSKGSENILKDFLEYILEMKINQVKLDKATELLPDFYDGKNSRVDVRAELADGSQVNIEMQADRSGFSEKRCLQYWSKLYSNIIERSEEYDKLRKTICIWIVDDIVYEEIGEFETKWKMKEDKLGITGHFNEIEIHVIELKKFRETDIIKPSKRDFWLWFIDYTDIKKVEMACMDNEMIREAREQLDRITSNKALLNEIIRQEMYERDQITIRKHIEKEATEQGLKRGMEKGLKKGMKQGVKEGMKQGIEEGMKQGMKEGLEQGMEKGMKQGLEKGKTKEKQSIAKSMKEKGFDNNVISEITGLTIEEIENL